MISRSALATRASRQGRGTPMRSLAALVIVAVGFIAAVVVSAHADHWPPDLWERRDREPF